MLFTLLQALRAKTRKRAAVRPYRPHFDVLEERRVLSSILVGIDPVSNPAIVPENGVAEFKVYRVGGIGGDKPHTVTVRYRIEGDGHWANPSKDLDRTALSGTLRFGETETVKTIRIAVFNDITDEEDHETFTVRLTSATAFNGAMVAFGNKTGTFTVLDDDDVPEVSIQPNGDAYRVSVKEANKTIAFTIQLSASSERDVAGILSLDDLEFSGHVGSDVNFSSGNAFTIKAGQKKTVFFVKVFDDKIVEEDESFRLGIYSVLHAEPHIVFNFADLVVEDNDDLNVSVKAVVAPFHTAYVYEGPQNVIDAVELEVVTDATGVELRNPLQVSFRTVEGTAKNAVDFGGSFGEEIWSSSSFAKQTTIHGGGPVGNNVREGSRYYYVELYAPSARVKIVRSRVKVVITDDD